jgi:hypothetical protein
MFPFTQITYSQCVLEGDWSTVDATCPTSADGTICCEILYGVTPGTGIGPYACSISPNVGTATVINGFDCFINVPPGNYTVTTTSSDGCTGTFPNLIVGSLYSEIEATFVTTSASCGLNDGQICATVTGGSGNFAYSWTGPPSYSTVLSTTNCISGYAAGLYALAIDDLNSVCSKQYTRAIGSSTLTASATAHAATCETPCNGYITIDLSGTTLPATISWSGTSSGSISGIGTSSYLISPLCAGTYSVTIDDESSCSPLTISSLVVGTNNADVFIYTGENISWNSDDFDGQTDVTLGGNLIIESGGSLEITNMTIRLKPNRHITVKSHGILITDNVTFDAGCGDTWAGFRIEALGNTACDATTNRGYLELNNSTITHADIGIANYSYTGANHGGRIHATNSIFLNNQRDLNLLNYSTANNATQDEYGGLFDNCDFVTTAVPHGTSTFNQVRINLSSINDVRFLECNMTNTAPGWFGNGFPTGVSSNFSQFQWLGNNNSILSGYGRGIRANGDYSNPTCGAGYVISNDVVESEFHCINSIFMNNAVRCQIYLNDIHPQPAIYPSPASSIYTGIQVQNTSTAAGMEFRIIDNNIEFIGITNVRRGVAIEHTRGSTNYIVRNDITNCNDGLFLLGRNRNATSTDGMGGTHFECNVFHSCARDINVTCSTGCSTAETGVANRQENTFGNFPGPYGLSAGNDFTDSQNAGNLQDDINAGVAPATGTINGFNYRYHPFDYSAINYDTPNDLPRESSVYDPIIQPYLSANAPFNLVIPHRQLLPYSTNFCDDINYAVPSLPIILQNLNSAKTSYNSLHAIYASILDGGNTEELKQNVLLAEYYDAMNLYQSLLAESPALSEEVMLAAIQKENELPASLLTMILAANPTSAKSAEIWNALDMRSIPLDSYQKAQIKLGYGVTTPKEMMEDDLGLLLVGIDEQIQYAIQHLVTNTSQDDIGLINQLLDPSIYEHDRLLAYTEMQSGDFHNGINRLKTLGQRHAIDSELSQHFIDLTSLIHMHHEVINREIPTLTNQEKTFLFDIRDNDGCGLSRYADDILVTYGSEESVEVDCVQQRSMFRHKTLESKPKLSIFPNPANAEYCVLRLAEPSHQDLLINVFSGDGSLFASLIMKQGQRDIILDLTKAASGAYQVLVNSGETNQSMTLIKL